MAKVASIMATELDLAAQRRLVEALRDPAGYPHPVGHVSVIETHISFVLLTGNFAYKIKKAVDLGFVDYTTLAQRQFFCEEELRLNRRLAPSLYLAVVPLSGSPEHPVLDNGGEPIEFAVKMTEFAQRDLLDQVLARDELTFSQLDILALRLAEFHQQMPSAPPASVFGSLQTVQGAVADNFTTLRADLAGDARLRALHAWCERECTSLEATLRARQASGWIREGHGDLHLGNLLLHRGKPLAFDCIEFNPSLRWIDVINDLAFLVMDLVAHGRPDYAWHLLNTWLENTGDYAGMAMLRFYMVYRALVRAKVACLRKNDPAQAPSVQQLATEAASHYLDIAQLLSLPAPRVLLITHGFSGSGKSRLARQIIEHLGGIRLRADVERKRLQQLAPLQASQSGLNTGLYTPSATEATYARLATLAETVTQAGYPVIIDAACLYRWQRNLFRELTHRLGLHYLILDCHAPVDVMRQRIVARHNDPSEATQAVLEQQLASAETLAAGELPCCISVDSTDDYLPAVLNQIRLYLQAPRCL